jgi:hypothetical protein
MEEYSEIGGVTLKIFAVTQGVDSRPYVYNKVKALKL